MMGAFTCPHCKTKNACNCDTCNKYIKEGEAIIRYTEDGNFLICGNKDCDKMFSHDQAIDQEYEERLEKYSERFDNKDNEIVEGIFNPETWGKRVLTEEDIFNQRDIDAVTDYINRETSKQETLEEVAERLYPNYQQEIFINGAKWQQETDRKYFHKYIESEKEFQIEKMSKLGINTTGQMFEQMITSLIIQQERMYSEEEVIELLQKALTHQDDGETGSLVTAQGKIRPANFFSWFERFKKK